MLTETFFVCLFLKQRIVSKNKLLANSVNKKKNHYLRNNKKKTNFGEKEPPKTCAVDQSHYHVGSITCSIQQPTFVYLFNSLRLNQLNGKNGVIINS